MSAMTFFGARPRVLLEVVLWRYGSVWLLVGLLALVALPGAAWWRQAQQQDLRTAKAALDQASAEQVRRRSQAAPAPRFEGQGAILAQLGRNSYADAELSTVLRAISQMAKAEGLVLAQADFQTLGDSQGGLRQVQLTLPLSVTYPKLRRFVEEVLHQFPGVSVDHLGIKREAISQGQIEVRLKLSIWIDPFKTVAPLDHGLHEGESLAAVSKPAAQTARLRKALP